MSLPFLKKKPQAAGLIMEYRKPDGGSEQEPEGQEDNGLTACAEAMIRAFNAKDANSLAKAFKDAFEILEAQPHDEAAEQPSDDQGDMS